MANRTGEEKKGRVKCKEKRERGSRRNRNQVRKLKLQNRSKAEVKQRS
jgi:hypothetical protein